MKLSIRDFPKAHSSEAAAIPFSGKVDLSDLRFFGHTPFPEPVAVAGTLHKQHGEVSLTYTASYLLHEACARCLKKIVRPQEKHFSHHVAESAEGAEDLVAEAPGGMLDMRELAASDLLFTLEPQPLCKEDCKGLCPWCGGDRNERDCDCESRHKPTDPRFDAIKNLLE